MISLAAVGLALACGPGGCRRVLEGSSAGKGHELRAALPADTRFVVSLDVARIRGSKAWKRLSALAEENPEDRKRIEELRAKTGLDPLRQIHRVVAAFPDDARKGGQYALIIEGQGFDERRLVAYAREQAAAGGGGTIAERKRPGGGRTLWASADGRTAGFFVGNDRFVLGGGGWGEVLANLADRVRGVASAADNKELGRLTARIDTRRALWMAALVPLDVRQMLLADPKQDAAASVTRLAADLDLDRGLRGNLVAELSTAADARTLAERLRASLKEGKRNATVLLLGLAPYLDGVTVTTGGPVLQVKIELSEPQLDDLVERAAAFARVTREKARAGQP